MFNKILVALDGTPQAASSLVTVRAVALARKSKLVLLRVIPPDIDGFEAGLAIDAEAYLASRKNELTQFELQVKTLVRVGEPAEEILRAIETEQIDLVVMGNEGRLGLERVLLGSVAEPVVDKAPVPVLLVGPGKRPRRIRTLLVPLDGGPAAAAALEPALAIARATHARLAVCQAVAPVSAQSLHVPQIDELPTELPLESQWEESLRSSAQDSLDDLARKLRDAHYVADGRAYIGQPAPSIVQAADDFHADMIVMSTHWRTGVSRAVLGSVADAVVRTAGRPVLLVHYRSTHRHRASAVSGPVRAASMVHASPRG